MDKNYNNSQNEFLWALLANPANDAHLYNYNLQRLVNDFPQSGILQALLAHSSEEKNLRQASVYFNARSLYKLINAPLSFIGVSDEKIIVQNNIPSASFAPYQHQFADSDNGENYFSDHTTVETQTETAAESQPSFGHEITQPEADAHHIEETVAENLNITAVEEQVENHLAEEHPTEEKHESWVSEVKDEISQHLPFEHHDPGIAAEAHESINEVRDAVEEEHEGLASEVKDEILNQAHFEHQETGHPEEVGVGLDDSDHAEEKHESWILEIKDEVLNDVPSEHHDENPAEEAHEHIHEADNAAEEKHESETTEIKVETIKDIPYAEPIINYASGMGHRLPPDTEVTGDVTADQSSETAAATHDDEVRNETPVAVDDEHRIESNISEEHAPAQSVAEQFVNTNGAAHHEFTQPSVQEQIDNGEQPAYNSIAEDNHIAVPENEHKQEEVASHSEDAHQPQIEPGSGSHIIEEETFDEITGNIDIEPDIISSIAANDYFSFDRAFGEHKEPEPVFESEQPATVTEAVNEHAADADQQDVSKYNDEKMPYSFLWWLDKTRKEHSGVYQPYVAPKNENPVNTNTKSKRGTDELQQQYYENIFHITSVEELDKSVPPPPFIPEPPAHKLKEQVIIERFIQEEPQIRPQSSDKLDNENKAKKSSEDRDELVSETLAAIYSDQMLYHKAIASYKKLMLKFPEKSRYFAAKIEQLEKKTN